MEASLAHILTNTAHPDYPQPLAIAESEGIVDASCFLAGINKTTGKYDARSQIYNSEVKIGVQVTNNARPKWWKTQGLCSILFLMRRFAPSLTNLQWYQSRKNMIGVYRILVYTDFCTKPEENNNNRGL